MKTLKEMVTGENRYHIYINQYKRCAIASINGNIVTRRVQHDRCGEYITYKNEKYRLIK